MLQLTLKSSPADQTYQALFNFFHSDEASLPPSISISVSTNDFSQFFAGSYPGVFSGRLVFVSFARIGSLGGSFTSTDYLSSDNSRIQFSLPAITPATPVSSYLQICHSCLHLHSHLLIASFDVYHPLLI